MQPQLLFSDAEAELFSFYFLIFVSPVCLTWACCSAKSPSAALSYFLVSATSLMRVFIPSLSETIPVLSLNAFSASPVWFKRART